MNSTTRKIVVGALSIATALTLVGGAVVSAFADTVMVANTTSAAVYTRSLTVGSTGADVTALQTTLYSAGYLKVAPTGYFGSLTKAALAAWQASVGISPASGYFGPITRAYLASTATTGGTSTVPGCVAGAMFSSTTGAPCTTGTSTVPGCTTGALYSSTTGASCSSGGTTPVSGTWTPDGTDGSITLSYVSYAPASQTLKKGDTNKPIISVKLQAVDGKVAVTRFDVHFSERPWLDFGSLNLTDSNGNILATKTLTGASDVTEVTVGSDYLVRFDNINPIIVTPGTDTILAVSANVLSASDKITGQSVYVGIPAGSIRTVNGKNYTDSIGLSSGQGSAPTQANGNTVVLSSTGSTASINTRIDPSSSPTTKIVVTSSSQTTSGVVLGVFGLKSQNQSSTINGLTFTLNTSGMDAAHVYSNLRVQVGGQTYGSNQLGTTTTFTNMNFALAQDQWVPVTLLADIQSNVNGVSGSSTLSAAGIVGVDANYNTVSLTSATNQTSSDNQYALAGISITSPSASLGSCTGATNSQPNQYCTMTMSFTVTNTGNSDVFISKTPGVALATSSSPSTASTTIQAINIVAGTGDSTQAYDVPAGGSRTFTYQGTFSRTLNGGFESFQITAIKYGTGNTDTTDNTSSINFGLQPLYVSGTL